MNDWKMDKRWSDRFLPEIKRILGEHLIGSAPVEEDAERNTDLIVLRLEAVRIACRIRKHKYLLQYGQEFTIRAGRPSGIKTELTKIVEGWGDYLFYGFADPEEVKLSAWFLGKLGAFRLYFNRELSRHKEPWESHANTDGSSDFKCFDRNKIPDFVVAQHE